MAPARGSLPHLPSSQKCLHTDLCTNALIEYFSDQVFPRIRNMGYQAVRTRQWKYIHYRDINGADELYDLSNDPYEMDNLISDTRAPLRDMQARLAKLKDV
jgi:N-acetylglucosamine-6-sulfatase